MTDASTDEQRIPWRGIAITPANTYLATSKLANVYGTPDWVFRHAAGLVEVVEHAANEWVDREASIVVEPGAALDISDRAGFTVRLLQAAKERDWTFNVAGAEWGWFAMRKRDRPYVHLGIRPWMNESRTKTLFKQDASPETVAHRLALYQDAVGVAWRGHPGLNGCEGIRLHHERKERGGQPLWKWKEAPNGIIGCAAALYHDRSITPAERAELWVHSFDIRAMYLSAMALVEVPYGAPQPQGPLPWDPHRYGYWLIDWGTVRQFWEDPDDIAPPIVPYAARGIGQSGMVWVTNSTMQYLAERAKTEGLPMPEICDTWLADRGGRYMQPFADRMRDALADPEIGRAIKATYAMAPGMMKHEGVRLYRPDWGDFVIDRARMNLLRKLDATHRRTGRWPLSINVDEVTYTDDNVSPHFFGETQLAGYGDQIGKFRHTKTQTVSAWLSERP